MAEADYLYRWGPRWPDIPGVPSMGNRKGQRCRVLIRGGRNSALVEFEDSYQAIVSRNALRRAPSALDRPATTEVARG